MSKSAVSILLAEDDEGHANLVIRNLQRAGLANPIIHVSDGQEALDYLASEGAYADNPPSGPLLMLLDINMPRVDGIEVLRQLRKRDLAAKVPVIVLTTTDDPREVQRCYDLGCSIYITKPVVYEEFVEAVRRLGLFVQIIKLPTDEPTHTLADALTRA